MRSAYFVIPMLPPSINANGKQGYKQSRQDFKNMVMACVSGELEHTPYRITYSFHGQWWKNGKVRRVDHRNFTKLLDDCIAKRLKIDDCYFFDVRDVKVESLEEKIEVLIEPI